MRIGILGLPQSGKRTLFTLLTGRQVPQTRKVGEPLEGVAAIHDPRVDVLERISKPQRKVYAENHFVLCPDVVTGAEARLWVEAARRCDLLCLVVRTFESDQVFHPAGSVDAARDRATLATELIFADLELAEKRLERLAREAKGGATREQNLQAQALQRGLPLLESERPLSEAKLDAEELATLQSLNFLTFKPSLWAFNVSEEELVRDFGPAAIAVSAQIEKEIAELDTPEERAELLDGMGLEASGLDRMNAAAYQALGLMSFYTIGSDEVRAWTIHQGSTAPKAAGKVHTDIERGFIRVEIIKYGDLVAAGSEKAVKDHGKMQVKGRDYVIADGDICHFLFNI
jgi:GTP-binding protein YchF